MRAMLAAKTRKSKFTHKFYGTTKRRINSRVEKTHINQHASFLIAGQNECAIIF
jgi:hypothetical protein